MGKAAKSAGETWSGGLVRLHWIVALLILSTLGSGYAAEHAASGTRQLLLYEVHFSLGLAALVVAVLRLAWRLFRGAPTRTGRPVLQRWAARLVHFLLYLTMFAALFSGWTNFMFLGPVRIFGLVHVPRLFDPETQEPLRALSWYVHHYAWWLLLLLICLHSAAALYHHFVLRDRTLVDFLPRR